MDSNPFAIDTLDAFDSALPGSAGPVLHEEALRSLLSVLHGTPQEGGREGEEGSVAGQGGFVLLVSPQPGLGKTHLLARLKRAAGRDLAMIPLRFRRENAPHWESVLRDVLAYADAAPGAGAGIRLLEDRARHFFAELTANLIRAGEIPCPNTSEALRALAEHPAELFDFGAGQGGVARWFCSVYETLAATFAAEASRCYAMEGDEADFWLRELYDYSRDRAGGDATAPWSRVRRFIEGDAAAWLGADGRSLAGETFAGLGKILAAQGPIVFVADHVDELFGNRERGRETASLLLEIPRLVPRSTAVLSVNLDLWESVFERVLPGAMVDRLTRNRITLRSISRGEAERLVDHRLSAWGIPDDVKYRFLPRVRLRKLFDAEPQRGPTPRRVLRHAKECWDDFAAGGYGMEEEDEGAGGRRAGAREGGQAKPEATPAENASGSAAHENAKQSRVEMTGREGVEFVSLTEDPMKRSAFEPLEPLRFETPLTVKSISPAASLDEDVANGPARPPARSGRAPEPPSMETGPARKDAGEPFDWNAAFAAAGDPKKMPSGPPVPAQQAVPPPAPPDEPAAKPAPGPELADTVGTLMKEAEKAFSGFREIFRQALQGEAEPVPATDKTETTEPAPPEKLLSTPETPVAGAPPAPGPAAPETPEFRVPEIPVKEAAAPASKPEAPAGPAAGRRQEMAERAAPGAAGSLPARYNRLRQEAVNTVSPTELDLLRFYRVIRAVGDFFPVVIQNEFDLPGRPGYRVVGWSYDHHLILFGFLGVEHAAYWRALMQYALHVGTAAGRGAWAESGCEVKLVVFTPGGLPLDVPAWVGALNVPGIPRSLIDVVDVDSQTAGGIYAAARLIEDVEAQRSSHEAGEIHGLVTRELDYFWRRLTRPVVPAGMSSPFERR